MAVAVFPLRRDRAEPDVSVGDGGGELVDVRLNRLLPLVALSQRPTVQAQTEKRSGMT